MIAQSMKNNPDLLYSLTHFDLSANPQLGLDPQGTLVFIQEPQTIATLNLSKCGINFDVVSVYCLPIICNLNACFSISKKEERKFHCPLNYLIIV